MKSDLDVLTKGNGKEQVDETVGYEAVSGGFTKDS